MSASRAASPSPAVLVFTILFPHPGQPQAGLFIRERMFRVASQLPVTVVAPVPWFPLQGLIRRFRPHFRPPAPRLETQAGITVHHPRYLSVPGFFKGLDGWFLALGSFLLVRRLRREGRVDLIDAHFAYPDGYAATLLGRWLKVPVTITLRGTEVPQSRHPQRRKQLLAALNRAQGIFSVADSLRRHVAELGVDAQRIQVVGNGVDLEKFHPLARDQARQALEIPADAQVLVSVGGLVERKGFHRVIECLPVLLQRFPRLYYLVVGGGSMEGNMEGELRAQVAQLELQERVLFLGAMAPEALRGPLSAADVFVLATRNEGWANVFLEAMACGLPVVTTDVGGNREVVRDDRLGIIVPFGDGETLTGAMASALETTSWDRQAIIAYAQANTWDQRVTELVSCFRRIALGEPAP